MSGKVLQSTAVGNSMLMVALPSAHTSGDDDVGEASSDASTVGLRPPTPQDTSTIELGSSRLATLIGAIFGRAQENSMLVAFSTLARLEPDFV